MPSGPTEVVDTTQRSPRLQKVGGKDGVRGQFFVPAYQRGYRWGMHEVEALLSDIYSNGTRSPTDNYCLQPVVVKRRTGDGEYELIDGQQRLTTLYLIYRYLNTEVNLESDPRFSLTYETRPGSREYLQRLDAERMNDNIDFYHMRRAYECIMHWFSQMADLLGIPSKLVSFKVLDYLENLVYVIWYEPENIDSITLFIRLNVGRIPLTNAELVKALLLSKDVEAPGFQRRVEIGSQWDAIEHQLQQPEFWSFLSNKDGADYPTRIELLFDLMARRRLDEKDRFFTFLHFKTALEGRDKVKSSSVWATIVQCYQIIQEWYEDRDLYHKLGYLITTGITLRHLLDLSEQQKTKSAFGRAVDELITSSIGLTAAGIMELNYDSRKSESVLLLFNVETVRRLRHSTERYPFYAHKNEKWSLEHIHAQNAESLTTAEEWHHWLLDGKRALEKMRLDDPALESDRKITVSDLEKALTAQINESRFTSLSRKVTTLLSPEGDEDSMHGIANLALLSKPINSSLSNRAFAVKRLKVIEYDRKGAFIPICTRQVFLKYYVEEGSEQMHFWSRRDRQSYLEAMISADRGVGEYLVGAL
jgi:hypothetical protein